MEITKGNVATSGIPQSSKDLPSVWSAQVSGTKKGPSDDSTGALGGNQQNVRSLGLMVKQAQARGDTTPTQRWPPRPSRAETDCRALVRRRCKEQSAPKCLSYRSLIHSQRSRCNWRKRCERQTGSARWLQ